MSILICESCFACEGRGFMIEKVSEKTHFAAGVLNYDKANVCPVCEGRGWIAVRNPF